MRSGRIPPRSDSDAAIGLVGGDRDIRDFEGEALQPPHQLPEEAAPPELRLVELGVDVVMVEDELLARRA